MSESEIAQGKKWVEDQLRILATEFGGRIEKTSWGRTGDDFTHGRESLAYVLEGKRHIEKFAEEDLEDCPNGKGVKKRLERRLRQMIKSACSPTPKIGFNRT